MAASGPCFFPGRLLPIRLDIELEDRRYRDAFLWHEAEPDSALSELISEAVTDAGFPDSCMMTVLSQAQGQVSELRELQAQVREYAKEAQEGAPAPATATASAPGTRSSLEDWEEDCLHLIKLDIKINNTSLQDCFYWDVNHPEPDPDAFARELCEDLEISDPQAPIARQHVGWREGRLKKARRGDRSSSIAGDAALGHPQRSRGVSLLSLLSNNSMAMDGISVLRPQELWWAFSPLVETVPDEDAPAPVAAAAAGWGDNSLEPKETRRARTKRKIDD